MRHPILGPLCLCLFSCTYVPPGCDGHVYLRAHPDGVPDAGPPLAPDAGLAVDSPPDAAAPDASIDAAIAPPDASPPDARVCLTYGIPLRVDPPSRPNPLPFDHGTVDGVPDALYRSYGGTGVTDSRIEGAEMVVVDWNLPVTGISIVLANPVEGVHFLVTANGSDLHTFTVEPDYGRPVRYEVEGFYDHISITALNGASISLGFLDYDICL